MFHCVQPLDAWMVIGNAVRLTCDVDCREVGGYDFANFLLVVDHSYENAGCRAALRWRWRSKARYSRCSRAVRAGAASGPLTGLSAACHARSHPVRDTARAYSTIGSQS